MIKSPSLDQKHFEESTFAEKSGAWDTDFMGSFLGDQGQGSQIMFVEE